MKIKIILAFLVITAVSIYTQPRLVIAVTGGYDLPLPQLKGTIDSSNKSSGESYWVKTGFNLGLQGKYAVDKKRRLRITFGGSYNKFSGEESYFHIYDVDHHATVNIISAGLGAEYSFTPKEKTAPFLGLELTGNFISGKTEEIVTDTSSTADHNTAGTFNTTMKNTVRFGFAIGGGVDVAFNKSIGAVFGAKYNWANVIGKEYVSSSAAGEYNLNDKEYSTVKAKNIMYFQIYLGVTFYIGQNKSNPKK